MTPDRRAKRERQKTARTQHKVERHEAIESLRDLEPNVYGQGSDGALLLARVQTVLSRKRKGR
jgi:hypothetical protein